MSLSKMKKKTFAPPKQHTTRRRNIKLEAIKINGSFFQKINFNGNMKRKSQKKMQLKSFFIFYYLKKKRPLAECEMLIVKFFWSRTAAFIIS